MNSTPLPLTRNLPLLGSAAALCLGSAGQATAGIVQFETEIISGFNHTFLVAERDFGNDYVQYAVNITDPSTSLGAMAFSFSGEAGFIGVYRHEFIVHGWEGRSVHSSDWADFSFRIGESDLITGASLGTFENLFGTVDDRAVVYWSPHGISPIDEETDWDGDNFESNPDAFHFFRDGLAASQGIALDPSGTIVDASLPSALGAVPEASEIGLLALGATGLLAQRRRRRNSS